MIDFLDSPFPYIACVSREIWRHIYEHKWQNNRDETSDDIVAFDLDASRVYTRGSQGLIGQNGNEAIPEFP